MLSMFKVIRCESPFQNAKDRDMTIKLFTK